MIKDLWILFICAGRWQIDGMFQAKRMGYKIIAIDADKNAEGFKIADKHFVVDIHDTIGCPVKTLDRSYLRQLLHSILELLHMLLRRLIPLHLSIVNICLVLLVWDLLLLIILRRLLSNQLSISGRILLSNFWRHISLLLLLKERLLLLWL